MHAKSSLQIIYESLKGLKNTLLSEQGRGGGGKINWRIYMYMCIAHGHKQQCGEGLIEVDGG